MTAAIDRGSTDTPLLEETIGTNLAGTVARFPDREALVVRHQDIRQTWTELLDTVTRLRRD